jgi:hypothetical protein
VIRQLLARLEKSPWAIFYEWELAQSFPGEFEEARREGLLRRVPVRVDGGAYDSGLGQPLTLVATGEGIEAFDDEDPEAEPLRLKNTDLVRYEVDLGAVARKFRETNGLRGLSCDLEDQRLHFIGEWRSQNQRGAAVLLLASDPRSGRMLLASLPARLPQAYRRTLVFCPTFMPEPATVKLLEPHGVSIRLLDPLAPFKLDLSPDETKIRYAFVREGAYWAITYEGRKLNLPNLKGLRYIACLVATPGRQFHVLELVSRVEGRAPGTPLTLSDLRETGLRVEGLREEDDLLDKNARAEYRHRLADLRQKKSLGEDELDEKRWLESQLRAAMGLGGRPRKVASDEEKARVNITNLVRSAIGKISQHDAALAIFLGNSIKTGLRCSYIPDKPVTWIVSL